MVKKKTSKQVAAKLSYGRAHTAVLDAYTRARQFYGRDLPGEELLPILLASLKDEFQPLGHVRTRVDKTLRRVTSHKLNLMTQTWGTA